MKLVIHTQPALFRNVKVLTHCPPDTPDINFLFEQLCRSLPESAENMGFHIVSPQGLAKFVRNQLIKLSQPHSPQHYRSERLGGVSDAC